MTLLDTIVKWLEIVFFNPFEPYSLSFDPITLLTVFSDYFVAIIVAGIISTVLSKIYMNMKRIVIEKEPDFKMIEVIFAGWWEELAFRGGPVAIAQIFGFPLWGALLLGNFIWAMVHIRSYKATVYTFIFGLFLGKFWLEGVMSPLWLGAIAFHMGHNFVILSLQKQVDKEIDPRKKPAPS